eukprot:Gb_18088 [translate_table: standard]
MAVEDRWYQEKVLNPLRESLDDIFRMRKKHLEDPPDEDEKPHKEEDHERLENEYDNSEGEDMDLSMSPSSQLTIKIDCTMVGSGRKDMQTSLAIENLFLGSPLILLANELHNFAESQGIIGLDAMKHICGITVAGWKAWIHHSMFKARSLSC